MTNINYDPKILQEVNALKHEAVAKTGLNDFGDVFFEAPLTAWVNDMHIQDITDMGRQILRKIIFRDLCGRLKVIGCLKEHPEILKVKVPPIILIMGAPRTGTTLLHNLMAIHPKSRPLLRWELMSPVPPPMSETYSTDPRISKMQKAIEPLRGSLYEKFHWVNADEPDENTFGFYSCTGLMGRGFTSLMIGWTHCLEELDHRFVFQDFRKLIQLLIWKCPPPEDGHLLLKCPMTTANIQQFAEVFPEARITLIHRDPFRALISSLNISDAIYQPIVKKRSGPLHPGGPRVYELFEGMKRMFSAMVKFQKSEPEKITNVHYVDLMEDAVLTTHSLFDSLEMKVPGDFENRVLDFLKKQRSGKRAIPPKTYKNFGLDADMVWADPVTADYCKHFDVKREPSRITDTRTGT